MNDELADRLDAVEQAVDPDPDGFHFRVEYVDEDGNVTTAIGDAPEDADMVTRLDARYADPPDPEGSDR